METNCDDEGCTYRVLITAPGHTVPLSDTYTSDHDEQRGLVKRINDFLHDPGQTNLEVETGGGWFAMTPVLFMAVGLVFAFLSTRSIFG